MPCRGCGPRAQCGRPCCLRAAQHPHAQCGTPCSLQAARHPRPWVACLAHGARHVLLLHPTCRGAPGWLIRSRAMARAIWGPLPRVEATLPSLLRAGRQRPQAAAGPGLGLRGSHDGARWGRLPGPWCVQHVEVGGGGAACVSFSTGIPLGRKGFPALHPSPFPALRGPSLKGRTASTPTVFFLPTVPPPHPCTRAPQSLCPSCCPWASA